MGDITLNISQHELNCKGGHVCDCEVTIDRRSPVIQYWQDCCDFFAHKYGVNKVSLVITSAARCFVWNRYPTDKGGPGSNDNSRHPRCDAIDGQVFVGSHQVAPEEIYNYFNARFPKSFGVGLYETFTHFDTRPWKARWGKS